MAANDLITWEHMDLSLKQNHHTGQAHDHTLVPGQTQGPVLDTGLAPGHNLCLGQSCDQGLARSQICKSSLTVEQIHAISHLEENALNSDRDDHPDMDKDHSNFEDHDKQLALICENEEPCPSANNKLAIIESDCLDESLSLPVDQNQDISIEAPLDMIVQQPLLLSPPILQSRPLFSVPNYELEVGKEFPDVRSCRRALRDAAIFQRFEMQTIKSDKARFTAKCAREGCPWRIHAAKLPGIPTFSIRTIHDEHTCGGLTHLGHQQASVEWVATAVEQSLRENPNYKPKEIVEEIHRVHGITLSYKQAWRGKERIMASLRGSFEEEYRLLPQYCYQIKRTNPGSIACVYGNPADGSFHRLFISFQASIYGFLLACRPLLGLDRIPLKSKYLGTLLFATAFDGDGGAFPLAFGVVDEENDDNWKWFLSELHNLLETNAENMPKLTILSDGNQGIIDGVEEYFLSAFHGVCMRHLSESFQKEFNDSMLVNLLWEAANALTAIEFEGKILEIGQTSMDAANWIKRIHPRLWATAYFEGTRFGQLTASVESLNTRMLEASSLPIIQMMETIRRQVMTWFNERREASLQWTGSLVPSAEKHVLEAVQLVSGYEVLRASDAEFQVICYEGQFVVDIRTRNCSCRGWQLHGLPCCHAVAALLECCQNVHRFTESCFTMANFRKTYDETIHPVPDKALWKEMSEGYGYAGELDLVISPPKSLRPVGRPRKRPPRPTQNGRQKRVVHCSRCKQTGHFRTTCTTPI